MTMMPAPSQEAIDRDKPNMPTPFTEDDKRKLDETHDAIVAIAQLLRDSLPQITQSSIGRMILSRLQL